MQPQIAFFHHMERMKALKRQEAEYLMTQIAP
jgi:hypothetical protein